MSERLTSEQAAFCRREHPRLVGAVTLYISDRDAAQDIAQEALTRACANWVRVGRMQSPGAWAHRVAMNLAKRHLRRARLSRTALARYTSRQPGEHHDADRGDVVAVRTALATLPYRQRAALVLRYYVDLSVADTATVLGCAEGTVKALTHQAITALRKADALVDQEVPDGA